MRRTVAAAAAALAAVMAGAGPAPRAREHGHPQTTRDDHATRPAATQPAPIQPMLTIEQRGKMIFKALDAAPADEAGLRRALAEVAHVEASFRSAPLTGWDDDARVIDGRIYHEQVVGLNRDAGGPPPDDWIARLLAPGPKGLRLLKLRLAFAVSPEVRARRDALIAEADARLRAGLPELARKYPQLNQTNWGTLEQALAGASGAGRITLWVGHFQGGRSGTKAAVPKAAAYNLLVVLRPLHWPVPQGEWALQQMYPRLALMGQVFTDAADPALRADLQKLVADALVPIEKLSNSLAGE